MSRIRSVALLGALAVAACSEIPVTPTAELVGGLGVANLVAEGSDSYLVRFRRNAIPEDFAESVAAMGGEVIFAHAGVGLGAVSGISAAQAATLAGRADIASVDVDSYALLDEPSAVSLESQAAPADVVQSPSNPATAFFFPRQWNMRAIGAPAAWSTGKLGKAATRVGILDTGIGYNHADLSGLVDLGASRSFLSAAQNKMVTDTFPGANVIADLHFHGTHVAATVSSNALAAAGVTSKVTLVGIKVCTPGVAPAFNGSCPTSAVLAGVLYAADIGLDVINMSLGGLFHPSQASSRGGFGPSFFAIMNAVFKYAHDKGTTVVVAAGNNAVDLQHGIAKTDSTPHIAIAASYCDAPYVICVSATGPTANAGTNGPWTNVDALAFYSNYGKHHITVAAPGGNSGVLSNGTVSSTFVSAACSRFTIITSLLICRTGTFVVGSQGTSMATPHVTGLAALIAGEVGHNPDAIAARLMNSADDLGARGNDAAYGFGRISVSRACAATTSCGAP